MSNIISERRIPEIKDGRIYITTELVEETDAEEFIRQIGNVESTNNMLRERIEKNNSIANQLKIILPKVEEMRKKEVEQAKIDMETDAAKRDEKKLNKLSKGVSKPL